REDNHERCEDNEHSGGAEEIDQLLRDAGPRGLRNRAEHHNGMAVKVVETGARDLCFEEVGHQPDFNSLQFTGSDSGFDLIEKGSFGADNDSVYRMFMQELH